jgi:hypothetical protein
MRLDDKIVRFLNRLSVKKHRKLLFICSVRVPTMMHWGGDIDLMILTEHLIDKKLIRSIRIEFFKKFGWQKIDLVNFTYNDTSVFKQLIQLDAIEL